MAGSAVTATAEAHAAVDHGTHASLAPVADAIDADGASRLQREPLDGKTVSTLKARAALCGVVLHFLDDDHGRALFVASKWSLTRQLHNVAEVDEFLRRIGGAGA